MEHDIPRVLRAVLKDYALPWNGHHGIVHWARVLELGEKLTESTRAKLEVACRDFDRLDLGRVGISPDPYYLSTRAARNPEMIRWADSRARMQSIPQRVLNDWKINLSEYPEN